MMLFFAIIVLCCFADPTPTGGGKCVDNSECGSTGKCVIINGTLQCRCEKEYGDPHCTYTRTSRGLSGGLQIGLTCVGVGGVGNFILGNVGIGAGQLVLSCSGYILCLFVCLLSPMACFGKESRTVYSCIMMIAFIIVMCAIFAGLIWSIVDGVNMLKGNINDSNGYSTYE